LTPAAHAAHEVPAAPSRVGAVGELAREPLDVEPEGVGVRDEILVAQRVLVLEEPVVHLPEPALGAGGLGGLRRQLGVRMHVRQGEVAIDEAQALAHPPAHLVHDRMRRAAVGTLVVAVLQQRDGCRHGAADVIALRGDGQHELRHVRAHGRWPPPIASSALRMPSAPGLTPIGET